MWRLGINLEGERMYRLVDVGSGRRKVLAERADELRNRGVRDVYLMCVDASRGFPQAIESIYPRAQVQLCIVHMVSRQLELCDLAGS